MRSVRFAVLTVGILSSPSLSNYNGFPVEDTLITATDLEYLGKIGVQGYSSSLVH